jgi:hypothetical protein
VPGNGVTGAAIRAVDKRIQVSAVLGIQKLTQAIRTDRNIRRKKGKRLVGIRAGKDLKGY